MILKNVNNVRKLEGFPSIFLDTLRFLSAFIVLIVHSYSIYFEDRGNSVKSDLSHGAVIIFFVLSGFVIAHTTVNTNRNAKEYFVARFGRLYSVFFPAIVITLICLLLIKNLDAQIFEHYNQNKIGIKFFLSLLFCNEIWFLSSAPAINGPIWSLSYEFWYYIIFGCFFYKAERFKGLFLPLLVCLIAGPKILLMMPVWLVGWFAYRLPRPKINAQLSWVIILALLIATICLIIYLPSLPNKINTTNLHWADKFISDWVVCSFIGAIFYLLPNGTNIYKKTSIFRKLGDLTFSMYVIHYPLLVFSKCLLIDIPNKSLRFGISLIVVILCCGVIGSFLESKRKRWDAFFKFIIR